MSGLDTRGKKKSKYYEAPGPFKDCGNFRWQPAR